MIESAILEFNDNSETGFAASIPDGAKRRAVETVAQIEIKEGRLLRDGDTDKVVLGINYENSDRIGKEIFVGNRVTIKGKEFEVVGTLKKKGSFTVDNVILMNEEQMKRLFGLNDTYNVIIAKVSRGTEMSAAKERIEDYLRKERNVKKGEEDFSVESPQQTLKNVDSVLFAVQIFIYVIAGISIIVGGIGIANTMYTSVAERTKQIGIMKSVGARNRDILNLFLAESGLLGLVGGIIGVITGLGIAYGLAFIGSAALDTDLIRVNASLSLIISALIFSFLIGSVSGLLPAIQASKLKPVEALRYAK
jgi:putative ABC transport system permease protein